MRVPFGSRAMLPFVIFLGLALPSCGSLNAVLTSDEPMRVDLELNVTRAGDITVLLWEDCVGDDCVVVPLSLAMSVSTGEPNDVSIAALSSLSKSLATAAFTEPGDWSGPGTWVPPRAALVDDVHHDPDTSSVPSSACCSPNLTDHVRRPFTSTEPVNLYLTRNGTHEWDPVIVPPNLPVTNLVLSLGTTEDDALNDGMTFDRVVALRGAVASATYSREFDVTVSYSGPGRPKHTWAPVVILHGYEASNFNADLAAGILRRNVVREAVAYALGLPETSVAVTEVADEPESERTVGEGACRFVFAVTNVVDPNEVARAYAITDDAVFLSAAKARMLSNALWELEAVSGRRGMGVTAVVTAEVRPNTKGAWVRLANGDGIESRDVNAMMDSYADDERVLVTAVVREYVANADPSVLFYPPQLSEISNAPPTPATVVDVVHRTGFARKMTALVVRFYDADFQKVGYHGFRVSFHNQRPNADARVAVLDGSTGGDDPWFSRRYVMLSRPPSPPPMPAPPPKVEGLDTRVALGPGENSVSPLGTSFEFLFEPLPGCDTCGVPLGTTVYARVAKEPELDYGDWQACTAVDVEATVQVFGGLNVTRLVKRFQLIHDPDQLGAYRAQAKSVDEDSFAPGMAALEDTTPVERRYIVGAVVTGSGVLDRRTGVISVTFTDPVPYGEPGAEAVAASTLLSDESQALLGPGDVRVAWVNQRTVLLTLPHARESSLCTRWRSVRSTALAYALRNNRPDVPIRLWTDPKDVVLPTTMQISWKNPFEWYDVTSGFQMTKVVTVFIDDNKRQDAGVVISGARVSGGCQELSLAAVAADGSWDGVAQWSFTSVVVSPNSVASGSYGDVPGVDMHPELIEIVDTANEGSYSSLTLDPSNTLPGLRYRFGASLTDCAGENSTATMDADRVAGAVPFVYPTSGRVEYVSQFSRSFTVAMETRIPDVNESIVQFGPSCDVDVTELTYIWTNLSSRADCFYTDIRSTSYDGYERSKRALRRTLTIPPFCLFPQNEPHKIELFSTFGSDPGASASRTEVFLTIIPSPLVAAMVGGTGPRKITKGASDFFLDASGSFDPDAVAPGAEFVPNTWSWSCGVLQNMYAFDPVTQFQDAMDLSALYESPSTTGCASEINELLSGSSGGPAVPSGVSDVMETNTLYRFTVQYVVGDRVANASTLVHAVEDRVPTVTLQMASPKQASSVALRLVGSMTRQTNADGSASTGKITTSWSSVPAVDFANAKNFLTPTDASSLAIAPNVLLPGVQYVFTLLASQQGVTETGYATTTAIEIVGPPATGTVEVTPAEGFALSTEFFVSTSGWGGGGMLLYSIGYVARGAGGQDAEVYLTRAQASTQAKGVLPADLGLGPGGIVKLFAYAEVPGGGGAIARAETTVRVLPMPVDEVTAAAEAALQAAALLEDAVGRAAAAVAACSLMNPSANVSFVFAEIGDEELSKRKAIRAGAMSLAIAPASITLDIVNEDTTATLDPDLVAGLIVSISTIAAVPRETTAMTAARGIETVKQLLKAPTSRSQQVHAVAAAVALFDVGLEIVAMGGGEGFVWIPENDGGDVRSQKLKKRLFRRALRQSENDNATDTNASIPPPSPSTTTTQTLTINPLSALALDGCTIATTSLVQERVANETIGEMFQNAISVSAARKFPRDLFSGNALVKMNHSSMATYSFPSSVVSELETSMYADVSLYRVDGDKVPSATRSMSDACAVDLRDDKGNRVTVAADEEIEARVPLLGSGLLELEKVVYQYRCARHVGGVWVASDPMVRTGNAIESDVNPGKWYVQCFGMSQAFLGYLVGVIIVPREFEVSDEDSEPVQTLDAYWFVMAFTAVIGITCGACALRRGMRRYAVKVANSDNAQANNKA